MKKSKFIEDEVTIQYKEQLKSFQQLVNPKKQEHIIEQLRQKYMSERGMK